jgi:rhamnulokinase
MKSASHSMVAVDLGGSSGRVVIGKIHNGRLETRLIQRFENSPVRRKSSGGTDSLRWDFARILSEITHGLRLASGEAGDIRSVGVDGWGLDYGIIGPDDAILDEPFSYRDDRTLGAVDALQLLYPARDSYQRTGVFPMQENTVYQLFRDSRVTADSRVLLLPDLVGLHLSGVVRTEMTNASTTGLLLADKLEWDTAALQHLGVRPEIFGGLIRPGTVLGSLTSDMAAISGLSRSVVEVAVGSHDTASAVAALPTRSSGAAYVSAGTWALAGVISDAPSVSESAYRARLTNERHIDGRTRLQRNHTGLWVLQECTREWSQQEPINLAELLTAAAALPEYQQTVDLDAREFAAPGRMANKIRAAAASIGIRLTTPPEIARFVIQSLATAFANTIATAAEIARVKVETIHVIGGGSQIALLCTSLASASGLQVVAGPVEASAMGNLLTQAHALGAIQSFSDFAEIVENSADLSTY